MLYPTSNWSLSVRESRGERECQQGAVTVKVSDAIWSHMLVWRLISAMLVACRSCVSGDDAHPNLFKSFSNCLELSQTSTASASRLCSGGGCLDCAVHKQA